MTLRMEFTKYLNELANPANVTMRDFLEDAANNGWALNTYSDAVETGRKNVTVDYAAEVATEGSPELVYLTRRIVYCVTVDATTHSDEVWPKFESWSNRISDVDGDRTNLGTTWEVWASTTDKDAAAAFLQAVEEELSQGYVQIEEANA